MGYHRKKLIMKRSFLLILCALLIGCGSDVSSDTKNHSFRIGDQHWSVDIPLSWQMLDIRPNLGEVLMAQNQYKSFILQRSKGYQEDIGARLLTEAQTDFFGFQLQEKTPTQWSFKGKLGAESPERFFWQKIFPIGDTGEFLIASCSQETFDTNDSECRDLLDSWVLTKAE